MILTAVVTTGHGVASLLPRVESLHFPPHSGTLNVRSCCELTLGDAHGVIDPWLGGPRPYSYGRLGDLPVAVLGAVGEIEVDWHLEILAPVNLRSMLGLADGAVIEVVM